MNGLFNVALMRLSGGVDAPTEWAEIALTVLVIGFAVVVLAAVLWKLYEELKP